ncbi:hypothetical protein FD975_08305 [Polynucleobacter sp. AP-Jannik-300A-C4]|uniref:hypothetical protein n=1 Tax=Polynucleobacter sp. AP-Jannik-300A-C4 TaxID=2576928 RepID=UPI001BFDA695|nr:hypothetical protein [Polynucleobacter sp. AP-Jannik-300A-C4]QWE22261.1 hypothetical protein FD975_08305 [Polynucleobacter sp. AP-Jannik-300A-C4]
MVTSALHARIIEELRHSNPLFYQEYCKLVEGISNQIRQTTKEYPDNFDYTSFTESYNRATHEPVLHIVIGTHKSDLYIDIYIHKDNYFVIGECSGGTIARNSQETLEIVAQKINTILL